MMPSSPSILIIDDQEAARHGTRRILDRAGFSIQEGATGMDCLRLAHEHEPDAIVLEVSLPDVNGFEVCRRIKSDPATASTAVLMISAEFMDCDALAEGKDCGADIYLTQPVSPSELISSINTLLKAHAAEREAQRMADMWKTTFDAMSNGIALLDSSGMVQQCNAAMARSLRCDAGALYGRDFFVILQESLDFDGREAWEKLGREKRRVEAEFPAGGQWFLLELEPAAHSRDLPRGAVCILSVITDRKRAEEQMREANRMLIEADSRKNHVLAMVANELRGPLAPIRYAQHIFNQIFPGQEIFRRQQAIIDRQLNYMSRLLEDLLDITRIRENKLSLRFEDLDLRRIVEQAVQSLAPQAEEKRHELVCPPCEVPLGIRGDPVRLEQIVRNLLSNAIKYTEPGGRIELRLGRENSPGMQGEYWAVLRVRDNGIGISSDILPCIFDLFSRTEPRSQEQAGLGIGLTMVRFLTQMHGGLVTARSEGIGMGSEFVVRLPLLEELHLPVSFSSGLDEREGKTGKARLKILVVDDNHDTVEALEELLNLWGYQAMGAYNGLDAIEGALRFLPDVILLDIGLPGMNGHEVCRRLRDKPALEGVILIAVTGYGREEDRSMAQESGFNHLMVKPVDLHQLRKIIAQAALSRG